MAYVLMIAEKPSIAKTIADILSKGKVMILVINAVKYAILRTNQSVSIDSLLFNQSAQHAMGLLQVCMSGMEILWVIKHESV